MADFTPRAASGARDLLRPDERIVVAVRTMAEGSTWVIGFSTGAGIGVGLLIAYAMGGVPGPLLGMACAIAGVLVGVLIARNRVGGTPYTALAVTDRRVLILERDPIGRVRRLGEAFDHDEVASLDVAERTALTQYPIRITLRGGAERRTLSPIFDRPRRIETAFEDAAGRDPDA